MQFPNKSGMSPNRSLTYMSIGDLIQAGKLFDFDPVEETPRKLYLSVEVADGLFASPTEDLDGIRRAGAQAVLESFVDGGFLTIAEDPFDKDRTAMMARVDPVNWEIFDFRCLDPEPGIRVLGSFCAIDEFVALTWDYREQFDDRWPEQVQRCRDSWLDIFGAIPQHKGEQLDAYLSYNFEAV
jgi:hypothetical protein